MGFQKLGISVLVKLGVGIITLITIISILFLPNCPVLLTTSEALAQSLSSRKAEADRLLNQGGQQFQTNQFETALQSWQQALTIYREIGDRKGEANCLNNLGIAYASVGQYQRAIEFIQPHLAIVRELGDRKGQADSLNNLGFVYNNLGQYQRAIEFLEQSLAITKEIGDRKGQANALNNLGESYRNLGQYQKAMYCYQQSFNIAEQINDRKRQATSLNNLGLIYNFLAEYEIAIELYEKSLVISREIGTHLIKAASLDNLGAAYYSLGQYQLAIEFYHKSLTIKKEIRDRSGIAKSLGNLGEAYRKLGQYQQAIEFLQQALNIVREIGDRQGEATALNNLGLAYKSQGQYRQAFEFHLRQLAIAREIGDHFIIAASFNNLGLVSIDLKEYQEAIEFFQESLAIKREIGDRNGEGISLSNLGLAFLKKGDLTNAEKNLRSAITVWEFIRQSINKDNNKISIFDTQADAYRLLQQVLILKNNAPEALEVSERGRARAFVDLFVRRLFRQSLQPYVKHYITYPTLAEIKQIAKQQKATIVEYSINYSEWLFIWVVKPNGEVVFRKVDLKQLKQQNITLTDLVPRIRDAIGVRGGSDTNEVAFKPSDLKRGNFVALKEDSAGAELWHVVSVNSEIGQLTIRLLSSSNSYESTVPISAVARILDSPNAQSPDLQIGYQILISPIADLLPKNPNDRVIFIPQGELFFVPFAALQDANGDYLIKKHTILTAPSIQVLDSTNKLRHSRQISPNAPVLVIGNPSPMPKPFEPLKYAEPEAREIARLLNAQPIIGTQATESAIVNQMPNARIIHLATHGKFDDVRGLGSAIALGSSGKDDGLLTAEEIINLKLNAELVVLSACDTGRGRLTGDGVIGLSRSLIAAGVPSVIVSLWKVPDDTTGVLMTEFYRNLQNNPDKAAAIRSAMLATMEKHPKPIDWAAFTLIGEAE